MSSAGKFKRRMISMFLALVAAAVMPTGLSGQPDASPSLPEAMTGFTPEGWQILGEVKQFAPETLYVQINGRASFFLAYDMIRLTYVSFVYGEEMSKFIDLIICDMGTPTNAFGVFSGERSPGESPLDLGRAGYRSDANYFIWQGRYYIRIISSEANDKLKRIGMDLARKVADFLPDSSTQVWGLAALPLTNRIPQSVQFFKVDAMGLDFMRNTYTAEYRKDSTLVTAFLSQQDSAESARATMAQYTGFAEKYGQGIERLKAGEVELVSYDMGVSYDVIFHKGRLMGGVSGVEDRELAIRTAIEIWRQLN